MKPHSQPPRKVIIGTCIQGYYNTANDLDSRIEIAMDCIDRIVAEVEKKYPNRPCDLVCLPEHAIVGGYGEGLDVMAVDIEGKLLDVFGEKAREINSNIVLPLVRAEDREKGIYYNSAAVIDRKGKLVGTYDKIHPVVQVDRVVPESGITPGSMDVPVFDLDFGRIGVQICFDMTFTDGWEILKRKGAEIIVWPTAAPSTILPRSRADMFEYYIVSSPFRDNATIFEPNGMIAAQVKEPESILVYEIDLSWMVLHWSRPLKNGQAFKDKFGDSVGYHFEVVEDTGVFWSNDPDKTIAEMAKEVGVEERGEWLERNKIAVEKARRK